MAKQQADCLVKTRAHDALVEPIYEVLEIFLGLYGYMGIRKDSNKTQIHAVLFAHLLSMYP